MSSLTWLAFLDHHQVPASLRRAVHYGAAPGMTLAMATPGHGCCDHTDIGIARMWTRLDPAQGCATFPTSSARTTRVS